MLDTPEEIQERRQSLFELWRERLENVARGYGMFHAVGAPYGVLVDVVLARELVLKAVGRERELAVLPAEACGICRAKRVTDKGSGRGIWCKDCILKGYANGRRHGRLGMSMDREHAPWRASSAFHGFMTIFS